MNMQALRFSTCVRILIADIAALHPPPPSPLPTAQALGALCDRTDCDIRSCLNTLQFLTRKHGNRITLRTIESLAVGAKDTTRGAFTLWNDMLQARMPACLRDGGGMMSMGMGQRRSAALWQWEALCPATSSLRIPPWPLQAPSHRSVLSCRTPPPRPLPPHPTFHCPHSGPPLCPRTGPQPQGRSSRRRCCGRHGSPAGRLVGGHQLLRGARAGGWQGHPLP